MSQAILVAMLPIPLPAVEANGRPVETRSFTGDFAVFDQASAICSTGLNQHLNAEFIAQLPDSIKLIANVGVGYDNIDLAAASARGIAVTNTPVVTQDTADLTFSLILAASRRLTASEQFLRDGHWTQSRPVGPMGKSVYGSKLGIVGFGEIGQAVARRARAFDMEILYHGPRRKEEAEAPLAATYFAKLEDMLAEADIVSLNCPLTDSTRHILNADTIAAMKPDAVLVNTGRGPLIDEAALVTAMAGGHLFGAGLDVFEEEPEINPGLLALDNTTLTPHMGSSTTQCRAAMAACAMGNVVAFFEGRELPTQVN